MSYRPRRTRLYDTSYNIGESYYKSALDNLDRKKFGKPATSSILTSTPKLELDSTIDEDLQNYRTRAHRAITEDPIFDSRGSRVPRSVQFPSAYGDDEMDEDVQSSLSRIRSNRSKMSSLINELDLDDSISKRRANLSDQLEDIIGSSIRSRGMKMLTGSSDINGEFEPGFKARTRNLKARLEAGDDTTVGSSSMVSKFKRTVISSDIDDSVSSSAASMRAKATKARLADIESDMYDRSEKQLEREKRSLNLKKLLAENDIDDIKSIKKVTF